MKKYSFVPGLISSCLLLNRISNDRPPFGEGQSVLSSVCHLQYGKTKRGPHIIIHECIPKNHSITKNVYIGDMYRHTYWVCTAAISQTSEQIANVGV